MAVVIQNANCAANSIGVGMDRKEKIERLRNLLKQREALKAKLRDGKYPKHMHRDYAAVMQALIERARMLKGDLLS